MKKQLSFIPIFFFFSFCQAQYTALLNFNDSNGASPCGSLTLVGKTLFGMTRNGGPSDSGTIFSVDTNGNNYKKLLNFNGSNGSSPWNSLTISGRKMFGITNAGGAYVSGVIFSIDTDGSNYKILLNCTAISTGIWSVGSLTLSGTKLFGMTNEGGANNKGCVFSIDTNGNNYKDLWDCDGTNGQWPWGSVVVSGTKLFGMISSGGADSYGTLFSLDTNGSHFTKLLDFTGANGKLPQGSILLAGNKLYGMTDFGGLHGKGNIFSIDTDGSHFTNLLTFAGTNGNQPAGSLIIANNKLFGMTEFGGAHDSGCIFSIDTNGANYQKLLDFNGTNGAHPYLGQLLLAGPSLFGLTYSGGSSHLGVLFKLDTNIITSVYNPSSPTSAPLIFPNPNNGIFTLQTSTHTQEIINIQVYNTLGQQVYRSLSIVNYQLSLDLSNQPDGVYLYRVVSQNGKLVGEGKLIIQK